MLDMGFEPQMEAIMKQIPKADRQTCLFSATWPKSVKKLAAKYLNNNAVHVNVGDTEDLAANKAVAQVFYRKSDDEKENQLWKLWDEQLEKGEKSFKMIVFANTKRLNLTPVLILTLSLTLTLTLTSIEGGSNISRNKSRTRVISVSSCTETKHRRREMRA